MILFRPEPKYPPNWHQVPRAPVCNAKVSTYQKSKGAVRHSTIRFVFNNLKGERETQKQELFFGETLLFKTNCYSFTATFSIIFTFNTNLRHSLERSDPEIRPLHGTG